LELPPCLPLLSEFSTWVGQHKPLYQAYKQLKESEQYAKLTKAQKKVINNALRDFELSGIGCQMKNRNVMVKLLQNYRNYHQPIVITY